MLTVSHFYDPKFFIDASYAINADYKSQSELVLCFLAMDHLFAAVI